MRVQLAQGYELSGKALFMKADSERSLSLCGSSGDRSGFRMKCTATFIGSSYTFLFRPKHASGQFPSSSPMRDKGHLESLANPNISPGSLRTLPTT